MAKADDCDTGRARTALTWLACAALAGGLLYVAKAVLVPLALAVLLTFLLAPLVIRLQRLGLPKVAAVLAVAALAFAAIGGVAWLVSRQVVALAEELPKHQPQIDAKVADFKARWGGGGGGLDNFVGMFQRVRTRLAENTPKQKRAEAAAAKAAEDAGEAVPAEEAEPLLVRVEPDAAESFRTVVVPLLEPLATAGLVVVLVIFVLLTREDLRNRIVTLSGQAHLAVTTKALDDAGQRIARYLMMQFVINVTYGLAVAIGLLLLGVPYAPLWGVAAAVLRYVPFVGPWVAAALPLGYSVLTSSGWGQPIGVVALVLVLELVSNNVVEPLLYGRGIGISPVAVIIAAIFWGWLWGPIGLVLATPLTVCLVVAGRYVPALSVFNRLLGEAPEVEPHFVYYQRLLAKDDDEAEELFDDHVRRDGLASACEHVLVPALELAKRDRMRGSIEPEQLTFVLESAAEHLEEVPDGPSEAAEDAEETPESSATATTAEAAADPPVLFGFALRDASDEAALTVMSRLLDREACRFIPLSRTMLISEVVERLKEERPAGLCILSVPPGGMAHARTLCKRLRAAVPDLNIAVGRWAATLPEKYRAALSEAGATYVGRTPAETRDHAVSMARLRPVPAGAGERSRPAAPASALVAGPR